MQNLDVGILKKIAILIATLLILIIIIVANLNKPPKIEEVEILDAVNNGGRVVHYSGDLYCASHIMENGVLRNYLIRLPIDFNDNTPRDFFQKINGSPLDSNLTFFENKLFYKDSKVYLYDLQKNKASMFCEGELQFMLEPNAFVMLQNGDLYKGKYYETTYMPNEFEKIATGNFIRRGEDEENVYYSSSSGTSNTIIVALNKEDLSIITLDDINTRKQVVEDVEVTDDYVYAFVSGDAERYIKKISKELDKNGDADITKILLDKFDKIEVIDSQYTKSLNLGEKSKKNKKENFNDLYFYGSVIDELGERYGKATTYITKLYKYSFKDDTITEYNGVLNELHTKSYSGDINGSIAEIYYGDKKLTEIETGVSNLKNIVINDINIVEHDKKYYLYYEIIVNEVEKVIDEETKKESEIVKIADIILARTLLEGGPSQRINIK